MSKNNNLFSVSNAMWVRKKAEKKISPNAIRVRNAIIAGVAIFGALSFDAYRKAASELGKTRQENEALQADISRFQKDAANLALENMDLKNYAEDAQAFALSIRPWLDENDSGCEDPNCEKCRKMEKENDKKLDDFSEAMDTIGINYDALSRLQDGYRK